MSRVGYSAETEIALPQETVYAYIAQLDRHGEWSADPLEVQHVQGDEYRSTAQSKGKTITAELRVLERHPPERFVLEATDLTGRWVHTFIVAPADAGTRVTREISGELGGAQLLLFWLVLYPIKRPNARKALDRLRAKLES